jgi:small subunit ribosomal protein S4
MGFAPNRKTAKQLVSHGHILVNSKKVDIPSYITNKNDTIEIKEGSRQIPIIKESLEARSVFSPWVEVNKEAFNGTIVTLPNIPELALGINPTLIVELYSK